jgi:hypothetical protein
MDVTKAKVIRCFDGQEVINVEVVDHTSREIVQANVGQVLQHLLKRLDNIEKYLAKNWRG